MPGAAAPTLPDPLGILESPAVSPPAGVGVVTVPAREAVRRGRRGLRFALVSLGGFGALFAAVKAKQTAAVDLAITLRIQAKRSRPLAALMHIYARFSRFAILSDKKKCISCNVCTSVCHQGIDIMNFANKGLPMTDPECVRCSACVQSCPTGVLQFGQARRDGAIISLDSLMEKMIRVAETGTFDGQAGGVA